MSNEIYELTISLRGRDRYEKFLDVIFQASDEKRFVLYESEVKRRTLEPEACFHLDLNKLRGNERNFSISASSREEATEFSVANGHWRGGHSHLVQKRDDVAATLGQGRGYCKGFEDGVYAATIREERRKAEQTGKGQRKSKPNPPTSGSDLVKQIQRWRDELRDKKE